MNLSELASIPMHSELEMKMVEIIVLKWRCPGVEVECCKRIIENTNWPFKLTVYDNRPNTPNTSRIWNKLVEQATCDYVCLLDSDAYVPGFTPCWLTRMMETFDHPDCRLVVPITDRCSSPQQRMHPEKYPSFVKDDSVWSGFCFLFRKELLNEVGKFDEEFVGYGQDSEFAVRLARNGGGVYVRRDVFVQHLHGISFKTATKLGEHNDVEDREYAQKLYLEKIKV